MSNSPLSFWLKAIVTAAVTSALTFGIFELVSRAGGGSGSGVRTAAARSAAPPGVAVPVGWVLTFDDEFEGKGPLDPAHWIDSYPGGVRTHSNNEQQYYASDAVTIAGGKLIFTAQRRSKGGMPYTSGMVSTGDGRFSQKYGRFEMRAKLPHGQGYWPAFWLLPASGKWPPEIDVLEVLGHDTHRAYMTNHWPGPDDNPEGRGHKGEHFDAPDDLAAGFHTYAVDWDQNAIVWYVDGIERARSTEHVPQEPMFVLANLAVGGDWPGMPDASTVFPATMEIEYIRVYRRAGDASTP